VLQSLPEVSLSASKASTGKECWSNDRRNIICAPPGTPFDTHGDYTFACVLHGDAERAGMTVAQLAGSWLIEGPAVDTVRANAHGERD
jgi:hypothetical protein